MIINQLQPAYSRWANINYSYGASLAPVRLTSLQAEPTADGLEKLGPVALCDVFLRTSPKAGGMYAAQRLKFRAKVWNDNQRRRCRATLRLFERCVPGRAFASVTQDDVLSFFDCLTRLPRYHHCSPRDQHRPIEEICDAAAESVAAGKLAPHLVGLNIDSIGNHIQLLRTVHAWLSRFVPVNRIYWNDFLFRADEPVRKRPGYSLEQLTELFSLPIWTGRLRPYGGLRPGPHIYQDSGYWVPLLCWYTAARREELCGLLVEDIYASCEIPHFRIRPNQYRTLKNRYSERNIPLHRELLRLGFLDYVQAVRSRGDEMLFPELYSPAEGALGSMLFKKTWRFVQRELDWLKPGQAFHSFRHGANHALKVAEVFPEKRRDLLGHSGRSEAETRYARASSLSNLQIVVDKIPTVTGHLAKAPVRLNPGRGDALRN